MENWNRNLHAMINGVMYSQDEAAAKAVLLEILRQARKVKFKRREILRDRKCGGTLGLTNALNHGLSTCLYHLYLVDKHLKANAYLRACNELEDVLHFTSNVSVGMHANIIKVLEAGLGEEGKKAR